MLPNLGPDGPPNTEHIPMNFLPLPAEVPSDSSCPLKISPPITNTDMVQEVETEAERTESRFLTVMKLISTGGMGAAISTLFGYLIAFISVGTAFPGFGTIVALLLFLICLAIYLAIYYIENKPTT
ncbi:MAG: hypothetical protein LBC42_01380 [Puniceicoccales bacterium]|jgi:hypothetical protein|nr:hypothetical protein [Puniceicoccales bacterium]